MGDTGETFKAWHDHKKKMRELFGVECPRCKTERPKAEPSILLPGQTCKVHPYRDQRLPLVVATERAAGICDAMATAYLAQPDGFTNGIAAAVCKLVAAAIRASDEH